MIYFKDINNLETILKNTLFEHEKPKKGYEMSKKQGNITLKNLKHANITKTKKTRPKN